MKVEVYSESSTVVVVQSKACFKTGALVRLGVCWCPNRSEFA